jgi:hypothetical protein
MAMPCTSGSICTSEWHTNHSRYDHSTRIVLSQRRHRRVNYIRITLVFGHSQSGIMYDHSTRVLCVLSHMWHYRLKVYPLLPGPGPVPVIDYCSVYARMKSELEVPTLQKHNGTAGARLWAFCTWTGGLPTLIQDVLIIHESCVWHRDQVFTGGL